MNKKFKVCVFTEGLKSSTYAHPSLVAFARGVEMSGDNVKLVTKLKYEPCDVAVIFGDVRAGNGKERRMSFKAEIKGRHINRGLVVIDTAILTRATAVGSTYRRIGLDGLLRNEADFNNTNMPPDRWQKIAAHANLTLHPWRDTGDHITIALQRPLDASLKSSERLRPDKYKSWLITLAHHLQQISDTPIHIRPHPASQGQDSEEEWLNMVRSELPESIIWDRRDVTFTQAMENCKLCITYNSGAGVDAALSGVPVMACDAGSFAWDVALHTSESWDPTTAYTPNRQQWLNNLSYVEWSLDEIAQGLPWNHLRKRLLECL